MPEFYSAGTIAVTNDSTAVVGTGTVWLPTNIKAGDTIEIAGQTKIIASVEDQTHLTLGVKYSGTTAAGLGYTVAKTSSNWGTNRSIAVDTAQLIQDLVLGLNFSWVIALSHPDSVIGVASPAENMLCPQNLIVDDLFISLKSAAATGTVTVDIKKNSTSVLTTLLTIDLGETSSLDAAVPYVLFDPNWNKGDKLEFFITVSGTNAIGLKACVTGKITELTP